MQRELAARPSYGAPADGGGPSAPPPWATAPAAPVQREAVGGCPYKQDSSSAVLGAAALERRARGVARRRLALCAAAAAAWALLVRRGAAGRTRAGRALLLALLQGAALAVAARAPDSVAGVKLG